MSELEQIPQVESPGDKKAEEYAQRIRAGEGASEVLKDLPEVFQKSIEQKLEPQNRQNEAKRDAVNIPPQYANMSAEAVEFIWDIPEYLDSEKTKTEEARKADVIRQLRLQEEAVNQSQEQKSADLAQQNAIRKELGLPEQMGPKSTAAEQLPIYQELSSVDKKKLSGWPASYELAKLAQSRGIDLSLMTREQYAQYAIDNGLKIDDDQLRKAPWSRMGTSVDEVVAMNKEQRSGVDKDFDSLFHRFSNEMMQKAGTDNRLLFDGVKVRQGTKDSNSWLFFGINEGATSGAQETYKSYLSVKDLRDLSPDKFQLFMKELQQNGYNGDIKIFQEAAEQGVTLNDQVVMHGATEADAVMALELARTYFGDKLSDSSSGKDEVINGKNLSYSQILAEKIKQAVDSK